MTILAGGKVVDGFSSASYFADVVMEGRLIVDVIRREGIDAPHYDANATIIDASNLLVTPGFIDAHSHSDAYLILEPSAPSKISQGITTEINGQCGGSIAPRYGEARLSSDWASLLGDKLSWRSLKEYREVFDKVRPAINSVQFIGHNTLRSSVMGYVGAVAGKEQLEKMSAMLEAALDDGGWGLTTGLIYQPGKYSDDNEVETLARVAARKGGFYATHMRSEGDFILESIDEVIRLAEKTGIRAEISHLKTGGAGNWGKIDAVLDKVEGAISAGKLLGSDRYPYCAAATDLDVVFPDWAGEGAAKAECARLADDCISRRIAAEIDASERDWTRVVIGGTWSDVTRKYSGKSVAEIVASGDYPSPGAAVCDVLRHDQCRTGAFFFTMCEENLDKIYKKNWIVPGSDASLRAPWGALGRDFPHPRAYATMPEFFRRVRALGYSLEETVARMTRIPAERFELPLRGKIAKGYYADIAVWSEHGFRGVSTYDKPHAFAKGMEYVFVNGRIGYEKGRFAAAGSGEFLTRN